MSSPSDRTAIAWRRTSPSCFAAAPELLQRDVDARCAARSRPRAAVRRTPCSSSCAIPGERLDDVDAVGERHDRAAVARLHGLQEPDRRLVHDVHLVRHARTGVDEDDEVESASRSPRRTARPARTPSSNTAKSAAVSPFTNCLVESVTVTFSGTRLAPLRKTGTGGRVAEPAAAAGRSESAAAPQRGRLAAARTPPRAAETTRRGRTATRFTTASLGGPLCKWRSGMRVGEKSPDASGRQRTGGDDFTYSSPSGGTITCAEAFEELRSACKRDSAPRGVRAHRRRPPRPAAPRPRRRRRAPCL